MSLPLFSFLRQRTNYLIGDTSSTTQGIIDSHINQAIADICNAYPFSWNIKQATGVIAGSAPYYAFNLATDYNPIFHLFDARIITTQVGGDSIFEEIVSQDRDNWPTGTYKWYPLYDTTNNVYTFNTPETSGTVTYQYNFSPATLSGVSDVCIVPDAEAVCYLAASKNWITDERNQGLSQTYKQEASTRIESLWQKDNSFGAVPLEGSIVDYNPYLLRR